MKYYTSRDNTFKSRGLYCKRRFDAVSFRDLYKAHYCGGSSHESAMKIKYYSRIGGLAFQIGPGEVGRPVPSAVA